MLYKLFSTACFLVFAIIVTTSNSANSFSLTNFKIPRMLLPIADRISSINVRGASHHKREIRREPPIRTDLSPTLLGEFSPIDVNDSEVREIADFATTAISASSNAGPFRLIKILKAESQVGIGAVNFKLTLEVDGADEKNLRCEVVVFDQSLVKSWTSVCFPIDNKSIGASSSADKIIPNVSSPLQGGYSPIDVNDAKVKEIARFAAAAVSINLNSGPIALVNIVKAESEAVAGRNYKLILELEGSDGEARICEIVVFDQPWTNTRILSNSNCLPIKTKSPFVIIDGEMTLNDPRPIEPFSPAIVAEDSVPTNKREIPGSSARSNKRPVPIGGFMPMNVNNEQVREIAEFATSAISSKINSGPVTLVNIVMAESQTVAGKNYKLTLELEGSQRDKHLCKILAFDQPWTKTRILSEFNCSPFKTTSPVAIITEISHDDLLRPITDGFYLFNVEDAPNIKPDSLRSSSFRLNRSPNFPSGFPASSQADFGKSKPFKLMKAITFWGRKKTKRDEVK
ncbi:hypothetical protein DAPPUDRAFT_110982 [Daphnia pulex]|uniref:Cystatin domain-containing protein n=1 Tax=Daphnia pulex TaxID=6669 RepID=E9H7S8_DAPPU|nr:hypothetical protein DAPPUDRAFT_110982 [Daphnia pulex]|eukprot:EFX72230.1 hypothetical protein DAPPUDRAFT_110982 [Daphnia pulex]